GARGGRAVGRGALAAATSARRPAGSAGLHARPAARADRDRAPRGHARRPRPARPRLRRGAPRGDRHRPITARPRRLPLAHPGPDRGAALVALARGRRHPLQGGGLGLDAVGCTAPAGLGRPRGPQPWPCPAGDAPPLPRAARAGADRVPVRAARERGGDPRLREDRHAPDDLLPLADLLVMWPVTLPGPGTMAMLPVTSLTAG